MESWRTFVDLILAERGWSWTLVGISYLVFTSFVHFFVFRGIIRETKQIDTNLYSAVRKIYLKNSLGGWILFSLSFILLVVAWVAWEGPFGEDGRLVLLCLLLPFLFFLSLIQHLVAFSKSLLSVLRQRMGIEKEF